jgi:hypothetical protein
MNEKNMKCPNIINNSKHKLANDQWQQLYLTHQDAVSDKTQSRDPVQKANVVCLIVYKQTAPPPFTPNTKQVVAGQTLSPHYPPHPRVRSIVNMDRTEETVKQGPLCIKELKPV